MKTKMLILTLASALFASLGSAWADEKEELDRAAAALNDAATPANHARVLERISKDTGVPVPTLEKQKTSSGLGYGELFIANSLAASTGKTFDQLLSEHKSGKGWGQIAKENNVKLGQVISATKKSEKALTRENGRERPTDARQKPDREHRKLDRKSDRGFPSDAGRGPGSHGRGGGKK